MYVESNIYKNYVQLFALKFWDINWASLKNNTEFILVATEVIQLNVTFSINFSCKKAESIKRRSE